jgi:NAD(P)-dependent dehydrogenase (short-subunit alcohol dehydrogenase family)
MANNLMRFGNLFDLSGRVAVVTGAAQGNGMGIANALCDAGAAVIATDILFSKEINADSKRNLYERIEKMILDVTEEENAKDVFAKIFEKYRRLDILVNNAGIIYKDRVEALELDKFKKVIDVNLNGTVICTKTAVHYMKINGWGRIVNISSSQAFLRSETYSAYSASKAAVSHLTRIWGNELARYGILVNALCPSYVMTPMMENSIERRAKELGTDKKGAIDAYVSDIPIKRILEIEEVANWVAVLCSELAISTTGNNYSITGGQVQL